MGLLVNCFSRYGLFEYQVGTISFLMEKLTFGSATMRWVAILKEAISTYKIYNIDEKYAIKMDP